MREKAVNLWVKIMFLFFTLSLLPCFLTLTSTVQPGGSQSSELSSVIFRRNLTLFVNDRRRLLSVSLRLSPNLCVWVKRSDKRQTPEPRVAKLSVLQLVRPKTCQDYTLSSVVTFHAVPSQQGCFCLYIMVENILPFLFKDSRVPKFNSNKVENLD
jgi:hypothetical protein